MSAGSNGGETAHKLIGAFIVGRIITPALQDPHKFGLLKGTPLFPAPYLSSYFLFLDDDWTLIYYFLSLHLLSLSKRSMDLVSSHVFLF